MSPLFNYRTLRTKLQKSTKSLCVELVLLENKEYFSECMILELDQLFNWLAGHLEIQTVIFSSTSQHFSRGLNIQSFTQHVDSKSNLNDKINSAFTNIRSFNRAMMLLPQIFIVDYGMGANGCGFEFGIGADLRVAHHDSSMTLCPLQKGLLPMSGGIALLEIQVGLAFSKKWNFLPLISKEDLTLSGYISSYYHEEIEIQELLKQLSEYSATARIQAKGCMVQGQLDRLEKIFNAESNYGKPLLFMNDWKTTSTKNSSFKSVTEIATKLSEHKHEIYREL